jgi:hypothetical protein
MFSPSELLELLTRALVERSFDRGAGFRHRDRLLLPELAKKDVGRDATGLGPGGGANCSVGRNHRDGLGRAVFGRESLDEVVRVLGEAHLERANVRVRAGSVEDDDAASALQGHIAGEAVHELLAIAEAARMEDVVPVEEEEHRLRMPVVEAEGAYLDEIARRLSAILGEDLVGVYAGGSYSLGGYEAGRSDLDVAAVVRRPLAQEAAAEILAAVGHEALPCPAPKLELVVYTEDAARSPSVEPNFELNLNTGPGELRIDLAPQSGEGHWFAIDRGVLASHGVAIVGPPAGEVFAAPAREDLLPILAQGLRWYRDNEPDSEDAVLNAARALRFSRGGVWVPKTAVRHWAETAPPNALDLAIAELESPGRN